MNLFQLSKQLTKLYNKLGNDWLEKNFNVDPFRFTVYVKKGDEYLDKGDYLVQIYSDPWMPTNFTKDDEYIDLDEVIQEFEEMAQYVLETDKTFEVKFMDVNFRD